MISPGLYDLCVTVGIREEYVLKMGYKERKHKIQRKDFRKGGTKMEQNTVLSYVNIYPSAIHGRLMDAIHDISFVMKELSLWFFVDSRAVVRQRCCVILKKIRSLFGTGKRKTLLPGGRIWEDE